MTRQSILSLSGIVLSSALAFAAPDKSGRLSGSVVDVNKDKSEISIRQGETAHRVVEFTNATHFTEGSTTNAKKAAPASVDNVSVGNYLTCIGTWDGTKLAATNCTVRPSKRP
ncbi:MAG TPA: hypothetical protein VGF16_05985 [Bryobacteraceae bacterium]|jgi:hypothetical protein